MTDQRRTVRTRLLQELDQWITGLRSLEANLGHFLGDDSLGDRDGVGDDGVGDAGASNGRSGKGPNVVVQPDPREISPQKTTKAEDRAFGPPSFFVGRAHRSEKGQTKDDDARELDGTPDLDEGRELFALRDSLLPPSPANTAHSLWDHVSDADFWLRFSLSSVPTVGPGVVEPDAVPPASATPSRSNRRNTSDQPNKSRGNRNGSPRIAARFDVRGPVASGAGIRTYDCTDRTTGRPVSVRVVGPSLRDVATQAFGTERLLNHPQIASANDHGELEGGGSYFVLNRGTGPVSLKAISMSTSPSRRPFSWEALLGAARKACAAVAYAHRKGVVHRALRPGSVFVLDDGHVVVADWCFAAMTGDSQQAGWVGLKRELGLDEYLTPEELDRKPASAKGDVYCLGVMLYELLAGITPLALGRRQTRGPFSSPADALRALLFGYTPPPPSRFLSPGQPSSPRSQQPPSVPDDGDLADRLRELDAITLRCLEKDPDERFDDADELLDALEGI